MSHRTKILLGDTSGDGHSQSESFLIESNLSRSEISKAYDKGTEILGLEYRTNYGGVERIRYKGISNFCEDYEDSEIPEYFIDLLGMHGVLDKVGDREDLFEGYCYSDQFLQIYLGIVKLGDPTFTHKIISDNVQSIDIGGYGLFG
jgi:hypothetical protein